MVNQYFCTMIERQIQYEVAKTLEIFPAIALLGPRQVGKTTLTRELLKLNTNEVIYFDLENDDDILRLQNPAFLFDQFPDACIVLDEIQRMPDLFRQLRPIIDSNRRAGRFVLTGSASPALVKGVSESLAGRIAFIEMSPINLLEAVENNINQEQHWFRGGFPDALTSPSDEQYHLWAENFIRAYIERDLALLFGVTLSEVIIRNFWYMLAANTGTIWTAENYAKALGTSANTIRRYLDFMEGAFMVRQLPAWFINVEKRVVKAPKVYIRDTGLLHQLNRIKNSSDLPLNLIVGASWEGYVIEQVFQLKPKHLQMYYYRTHNGAECDLILVDGIKPVAAIEIKYALKPSLSRGFYSVLEDLKIQKAFVITPGDHSYALDERTTVSGLQHFLKYSLQEL